MERSRSRHHEVPLQHVSDDASPLLEICRLGLRAAETLAIIREIQHSTKYCEQNRQRHEQLDEGKPAIAGYSERHSVFLVRTLTRSVSEPVRPLHDPGTLENS
jgi:hypothetical protein